MIRKITISIFILLLTAELSHAQHWKQVFTVPSIGSAAYFFNADAGCIGTGSYPGGSPAQIYYTSDGGNSWTRSLMPNMDILGQVTDIFFYDRWNGWATIRERIEHGWSGIYKTSDGGKSWALWYQAEFPVAIRQTAKGIFFTDRYNGVCRSTDGGLSFQIVAVSNGILGLDFLDNNIGIASSEGTAVGLVQITTDGGSTWNSVDIPHEAWTAFADVATGQLLFASERNPSFNASGIFGSADDGASFTTRFTEGLDGISGGIAGTRWCRSVIYVQGEDSTTKNPGVTSMMRSVDGGNTWIRIGGPANYNDKRFAVTGKGAVVYTFDRGGGVWKTSDGGDGTLTASALGRIFMTKLTTASPLSSKLCDSADYRLQFTYSDCDSMIIDHVAFIDDNIGELSVPNKFNYFGKDNTKFDTLIVRFKPRQIHQTTERIRITLRQADGFLQDTIITITVQGIQAKDIPFITEVQNNALDFGTRSVCADDSVRTITITNIGCAAMNVTSLSTNGIPFNLLSSFQPFSLDPGISRTILLQFQPSTIGSASGTLILNTSDSNIIINLTGIGKAGTRGYKISQPQFISTICDSTEGDIIFKNISCTPVLLDSFGLSAPFRLDQIQLPIILQSDSSITFHVHFIPSVRGQFSNNITIHSFNDNDTNNRFDTTLEISAVATGGTPGIAVAPSLIDFGSLNTCIYRDSSFTIYNTGCDTLKISDEQFTGSQTGYTILQSSKGDNILRGNSAEVMIRFKPPGIGVFTSTLHLTTNAGNRDIILNAIGTNDPGTLSINAMPIGSVLTCKDSGFSISLSNTTCDSLFLDSVTIGGAASSDYSVSSFSGVPMPSGSNATINGKFSPQANGIRSAVINCFLHLIDGSVKEVTSPINGIGIQPAPIRLSLPNITLKGIAGSSVLLPIQLLDTSIVSVSSVMISIDLNTDVLEPQQFDLMGSVISGAAIPTLQISKNNVVIHLDLPAPQKLGIGLLGTLVLEAYLSDSSSTGISLTNFSAFDSANSALCLPTSIITPPVIVTDFVLSNECGDSSISGFMKNGISGLLIEKISPNPTENIITVTIRIPKNYHNDGTIEIFDGLGNQLQSEPLIATAGSSEITKRIALQGASGLRMLRVRSPQGSSSGNIYLLK